MFGGISKELAKQKDNEIERLRDIVDAYEEYLTNECGYERVKTWYPSGFSEDYDYKVYQKDPELDDIPTIISIKGHIYNIKNSRYNLAKYYEKLRER